MWYAEKAMGRNMYNEPLTRLYRLIKEYTNMCIFSKLHYQRSFQLKQLSLFLLKLLKTKGGGGELLPGPFEKIAISTEFYGHFHLWLLITFQWYAYNIKHFARFIVIKQPPERSPRTQVIGFDSLCCSNRLQLHCQTLGNRCECHRSIWPSKRMSRVIVGVSL